jgi:outer membrane protein
MMTLLLTATLAVGAQGLKFGYFSYDEVQASMDDYIIAKANVAALKDKYDAEIKRSEKDFNDKYEEFLEEQRDLAPAIYQKRQAELQDLLNRNIAFKNKAERLLKKAEVDAMAPVRERLLAAVRLLGRERGYVFILNTDRDALPYMDESLGENVTDDLIKRLKVEGLPTLKP